MDDGLLGTGTSGLATATVRDRSAVGGSFTEQERRTDRVDRLARYVREPNCTENRLARARSMPHPIHHLPKIFYDSTITDSCESTTNRYISTIIMPNPEISNDNHNDGGEDITTSAATTANGVIATAEVKDVSVANPDPTSSESSNGHFKEMTTSATQSTLNGSDEKTADTNPDGDDDEENVEVVEEDEEENLLMSLEEKAEQEADHEIHQPNAVEEAPRLLQAALKEGQVKADESEEEEEEKVDVAVPSPEVHVHKRVRGPGCHWCFLCQENLKILRPFTFHIYYFRQIS